MIKDNIPEDILDLNVAKQLFGGNEEALRNILHTFMQGLPQELANIEAAHNDKNWPKMQSYVHKLMGGASYCGTKRLIDACKALDANLKTDEIAKREMLYQELLSEINLLKEHLSILLK